MAYNRWISAQYCYPNELYHHGVKGMRWGVRKERKAARLRSNIDRAKQEKAATASYFARARKAKETYMQLKGDQEAKVTGRLKEAKREYKTLNKRSAMQKNYLNERQAQWKIDKNEKKLNRLNGIADNRKVSMVSPKVKHAGKKILGTLLRTAVATAVSSVGLPFGYGAVVGAKAYSEAGAVGRLALKATGIDSIGEAAIEGGRAVVETMLGGTYYSPAERAARKTVRSIVGGVMR